MAQLPGQRAQPELLELRERWDKAVTQGLVLRGGVWSQGLD